jgi:UDP-glucose 4-epimerase
VKTYIVTGGSGFFGGVLKRRLLAEGNRVINVDLHADTERHSQLTSIRADIRDAKEMNQVFGTQKVDGVFHAAAVLAHDASSKQFLWTSNVLGTKVIAECAKQFRVPNMVFISSNCLWGQPVGRPVTEEEPPNPIEPYGQSKWEGEKILASYSEYFNVVSIRTPTIVDAGRLGLLAILFEFIDEGRHIWTVGGGHNRYQFIYAEDLCSAAIRAISHHKSDVFNVGSDNVKTLREVYSYVIERAQSRSKVADLPRNLTLLAMKFGHKLKLSPLGPYHYKMIAEDFVFDTTKIKQHLGWSPTVTNEEMLWRAFHFYSTHRAEIESRKDVSAHNKVAKMGAIRLLKWVS